jgi:hypothetical protein
LSSLRRRLAWGPALAVLALTGTACRLEAQSVMVAPTAVIIRDGTPSSALTLISQDAADVEITISTIYGYPVTDSAGQILLRTFETPDDTMPAASAWVTSYPRRLVLPAGARRTVRLVATPPPNLPPGEYWGRIVVAARGGRVAVAGTPAGISAGLNLEIRSVIGLFYRKGPLKTGLAVNGITAGTEGDSVVLKPLLVREGPAAFVGTVRAELRDRADSLRAAMVLPLGVYYNLAPRLALSRAGLPAGKYRVIVSASVTRPDLPNSLLTPAAPVRAETTLELP